MLENCQIDVDREAHLNYTGRMVRGAYVDEKSVDVLGTLEYHGRKIMLFFECKDVTRLGGIGVVATAWRTVIPQIIARRDNIIVLQSEDGVTTGTSFRDVDEIRLCYVFGDGLSEVRFADYEGTLNRESFIAWNLGVLRYFEKVSGTLGKWTRYEILREFGLNFDVNDFHSEPAVEIRQADFPNMYLMGLHPGLLLKLGYVFRRTSTKPKAYQRMINKDRIAKISGLVNSGRLMLPNAIVIAFDNDPEVQRDLRYDGQRFYFPQKLCSAWIIDGQHRAFGFLKTRYYDWDDEHNDEYKLPVVAFKNLDEPMQSRAFVNINYYQKKIDPTLLCDLAGATEDLSNELTWPSLLAAALNSQDKPLNSLIRVSEFDTGRPISLSSFARYGLLDSLLGFNRKRNDYSGPLFNRARFYPDREFRSDENQRAFAMQSDVLTYFFSSVRTLTSRADASTDPWRNWRDYSLVRTTGINAQLLVLKRILDRYPGLLPNLPTYLRPIAGIRFTREVVARQGGGWKGFRGLANRIISGLNRSNRDDLRLYGEKEKS